MKRVFSFLMAMVLVIGLVSMADFTVFAAVGVPDEEREIKLEVAKYRVGELIPDVPAVTLYMPGTITEVAWSGDYTGTFADWGQYAFSVIIEAPEGQSFQPGDMQYYNVANSQSFSIRYLDDSTKMKLSLCVETSYDRCYSFRLEAVLDDLQPGDAFTPNVYMLSGMAEIESVCWVDMDKQPVSYLEKGGNYLIEVAMRPAENYAFAENLDIDVNGRDMEYGFPDAEIVMPNNQELKLYLPFSFKETVDSLTVQIGEPAIGASFDNLSAMADKAIFVSANVYDGYSGQQLTEGTFQEGYLYEIQYTLRVMNGYQFADWINIDVETPYAYSWGNDRYYAWFSFYYQEGGEELNSISIDVPDPVPGTFVRDYKLEIPEGAPFIIEYMDWTDLTTDNYSPKEFIKDHRYLQRIEIIPAQGYAFSAKAFEVFINGESVRWFGAVDGVHVERVVSLIENEQYIDSAEMQVDGIAVGATLDDLAITIPEDAPYKIDHVYLQDGDMWEETNILEDGKKYYLFVLLKPKSNYIFNEQMQISGAADSYNVVEYGTLLELVVPISFRVETMDELVLQGLPWEIQEGPAEVPELWVGGDRSHIVDAWWENNQGEVVEKFVTGNGYQLVVQVEAEKEWQFPEDVWQMHIDSDSPVGLDVVRNSDKLVTVYCNYTNLMPVVTELRMDLPNPQVGMRLEDLMPIVTGGNLVEYILERRVEYGMIPAEKVENNQRYELHMTLEAPEGYCFSNATDVFIDNEDFQWSVSWYTNGTHLYANYAFATYPPVGVLDITATIPEPGMSIEDVTVTIPEDADCTLLNWAWYDLEYWSPVEGTFEEDKEYYLEINLEPKEGYAFLKGTTQIFLNADEADWYTYSDNYACASYFLSFRKEPVYDVNLGELPERIEPGKATVPAVELESDSIIIADMKWVDSSKNKTVTKFEDGKAYYLAVTLQTTDRYVFSEDEVHVGHWYGYAREITRVSETEIIAYFRYSLEPDVGKVTITPGNWSVGAAIEDVGVNVDGHVQIEYMGIYDTDTYEDVISGKIEKNKSYCINISFIPKDGYRFGDETEFEFADDEYISDWWGGEGYRVMEIYFSTKQKITEVKVDLQGVGIGKNIADVQAVLPKNAPYTARVSWYDVSDGWSAVEDGVFLDGHKYQVAVSLTAKENYVFPKEFDLILDGEKQKGNSWGTGESADLYKYFSYLKPITKVELPKMPTSIKKGQTLPTDFAVDKNAHYTLRAEWGLMQAEGLVTKVEDNGSYVLYLMIEAESGYEFTEDVLVYVDGKPVKNYLPSGDTEMGIYFVYNIGLKEIDRIDLTTNTIAAGNKVGEVTVSNNANVVLEDFNWFGNMDGNIFEADGIDAFEKDMYVYLQATVSAKDGYAFASDAEIYINGQKAGVVRYVNVGYYAMYAMELGKLGEQEQVRTEKLTTPKVSVADSVLAWAAVADADAYEIYRSTKKSSGFKKIDTITETEYFDQGATAGKTYYYKVKAIYSANTKLNSADSAVVSVDYKIPTPVISAKVDSATGKTVISWGKVSVAKSYDVYRATEVDGKYTKIGNTKSTSYTDSKAELGVEYYYKVVAVASSSKYNSNFSGIYMCYSYLARPDAKIEVDEASGKPSLSWKKVSDAIGYRILRKLNGAAEYEILTETTALSFTDTTAPLDSMCEYRVVALHENEYLCSAYSVELKATVTFGRPVIKGSNNEEGKIVLSWNEIDGAVSYEVLRSTSSSKGFKVIATVTEGTTYTDTDAEGGKTYYYQVVAAGENTKSKASAAVKLTGTCAAPEIIIGRNPATGKLVVEWEKVSGAKSYEIWRATSADGKYTKIGTSKTTSYVDTKSEVGKTYFYKVKAIGSKSAYNSVFSNIESWSAVLAQPSVKITIDEASGKPSLSWGKVSGAIGYRIIRSLYDWSSAVELIDVTGTSFIDTTAPLDSNCSYAVIALYGDEQFNSVESNVVKATVTFGRPVLKGSINADGQPTFTWAAIDGALKYEILRSTSSSKGFAVIATVTEGTAYTDETATPGKTYYYQVVAVGANTKSKASASVKLTGTCAAPVIDQFRDAASGKPVISWQKVNGAKSYDVYYATSANGKYKKLGNTKNLSYTDTKATVGTIRYYKVVAVGSKSSYNSPYSNVVSGMCICAQPQIKTGVDAATGKPSLSWNKVTGAVNYRIWRIISTEGGDFVEIANVTGTTFIDKTAPIDTLCYYMIAAYPKNEGFGSVLSEVVEVTSGIAQPKLNAGLNSDGQPRFDWQQVEGAVKYEIYRSTSSSSKGFTLYAVKEEGNAFFDEDVTAGKTYYYKVIAIGAKGKSVESEVVKLTATCAVPQPNAEIDAVSGKPSITWEKIPGAKSYEIYRSTNKYEGKYTKIGTSKTASYIDTKAVPGTTYYYKVKAIGSKSSYNSALSQPTMGVTAYAAQPQVTVKFDSKGAPIISWKKVSEAEKYYLMYVDVTQFVNSETEPDEDYIAQNMQYEEINKKKTSYTLTQAEIGHAYIITMVAVPKNEEFFSLPSDPEYVVRACVAPKIKAKYVEGYNSGDWSDVPGADFYNVYCATSKKGEYEYIGYIEGESDFVHTSAVKGRTYYYKVTACTYGNSDTTFTESAMSNVISIKTKK